MCSKYLSEAAQRVNPSIPRPDLLQGIRILIVEDDDFTRLLLVQLLSRFGAVTNPAASVQEGIAKLHCSQQDLIISDIAMPERDGHDFIRFVRQVIEAGSPQRIPAIAISAHTDQNLMRKSLAEGFQVHLSKPVNIIQLVEIASYLATPGTQAMQPNYS